MLTPIDARILQVFWQMLTKTLIEVKDFRVEFRWVINSAYVATQHIHSLEAPNCEHMIIFRPIDKEAISAAVAIGEEVCN